MVAPYPLVFEPILLDKVWGGRRLERLGKTLPAGKKIGESWELADLAATSSSGAGGGEARSVIASGMLAGKTLHDAMVMWRRDLMGGWGGGEMGRGFPLLIKFLDAQENLSVQVHPSPAYAAAHAEAHLKTECWYVLDALPGSVIYKGIKAGVSRESFAKHIMDGSVVDDLIAVPALVGECHNLPSGTCHALGGGVLVAEVQTPSDTTFRVYDWGRKGRELHIEQALACIDFGPAPGAASLPKGKVSGQLVGTEFFRIHEAFLPAGGVVPLGESSEGPRVLIVLSGSVSSQFHGDNDIASSSNARVDDHRIVGIPLFQELKNDSNVIVVKDSLTATNRTTGRHDTAGSSLFEATRGDGIIARITENAKSLADEHFRSPQRFQRIGQQGSLIAEHFQFDPARSWVFQTKQDFAPHPRAADSGIGVVAPGGIWQEDQAVQI